MRPNPAARVAASALVAQAVFSVALPAGREVGLVLLVVVAALGLVVGHRSRQNVPLWFVVGLTGAGMALVLVGLAVEDALVGPSGPQYTPVNTAGSVALIVAALAAGIALGGAVRGRGLYRLVEALSERLGSVAPTASARVALAVLVAITVAVRFYSGSFDVLYQSLPLMVLGPAAIGAVLGWVTRAGIPIWLMIALPAFALACHLVGWGQYNDDGDSGALVGLVVLVPGLLAAGALTAGMAAGASWRLAGNRA